MPISVAKISKPRDNSACRSFRLGTALRDCAGFTLLELSLVLLIIAVVLMLVMPRFRDPGRANLLAQSHRLELTFRLLRSQAVLNGDTYRLNFDLDQQRYWATPGGQSADLGQFARDLGSLARATQFESPIGMTDVVLPTLAGKVANGQIYTAFYPDGSVDPTVIHLSNGAEAYTLWLNPTGWRLKTEPGYHDVQYGQ